MYVHHPHPLLLLHPLLQLLLPASLPGRCAIGAVFHCHLRVCAGAWYRARCAVCRIRFWCRDTAGVFNATSVSRVAGSRVYKETVTGWNEAESTAHE